MKGKLISLVTLFLCMMGSLLLHAQSVQQGKVLEYQGSAPKTPLAGVSIAAKGAAVVQSNAEGQFSLDLRTHHAGDAIQFRRVELNGYEVMNQEALEAARVARAFNPNLNPNANRPQDAHTEGSNLNPNGASLNIVMIRKEALRQLRDGYRSVAAQRYKQQLKASTEEIERLMKVGQLAEEQYNERMNALEEAYEDKLTKLETYIDKFARIDLSDLDQDEQQIIDLVQAGNFDEALDLYDKQNLADRLRQSREDQQKLVAMRDQLSDVAQKKAIENEHLRQSIDRHVTLLKMAGGEDNLFKIHTILHQTYLADTTDLESRRQYALSLETYGQKKEQLILLRNGILVAKDDFSKGLLLIDLMRTLWNDEQYEESMECALNVERLLMPQAESDFSILTRALPAWSEIQLNRLLQEDDYESCKKVVEKVNLYWSPDSLSFNSMSSYIMLLSAMSDYYSRVRDHERSMWSAKELFILGNSLQTKVPWSSIPIVAYSSACSIFILEGKKKDARNAALNCVSMAEALVDGRLSPIAYVATHYYLLVESLVSAGEFALADSVMQSANQRRVFEKIGRSKNQILSLYSALYHYYQAQVWLFQGKLNKAEMLARESLTSLEMLEEGAHLALFLKPEMEARIHLMNQRYTDAERFCHQAIKVCKENFELSKDAWDADALCRNYILLAEIYKTSGNVKKMQKTIDAAERIAVFESNREAIKKMKNN